MSVTTTPLWTGVTPITTSGNAYGTAVGVVGAGTAMLGTKLRYTEYQAAMGLAQLKRLPAETALRHENAEYLKARLSKIPGIIPYRFSPGVTRAAFHLFPFRFDSEAFGGGLTRSTFLKALAAEGVPCSSGYTPLNKMPYVKHAFETKNFRRMYTAEELITTHGWRATSALKTTGFAKRSSGCRSMCYWPTAQRWTASPTPSRNCTPTRTSWRRPERIFKAAVGKRPVFSGTTVAHL